MVGTFVCIDCIFIQINSDKIQLNLEHSNSIKYSNVELNISNISCIKG